MRSQSIGGWAALLLAAAVLSSCDSTEIIRPASGALDSLAVVPDSATVTVGGVTQFTVVAFDSAGRVTSVTPTWSTSDETVITVDPEGRVFGVAEGRAWVIATAGGLADSATVHVAAATRGWFTQISGVTGTHLNGIHVVAPGRDGWIVGDAGRVLRTYDGGNTWTLQTAPSTVRLNSVWFTSVNEGWIVGDGGVLLRTTNGGLNWSRVLNAFASENLEDVWFSSRDSGWVVGGNGVILRTTNAGTSWERRVPVSENLASVAFHGARDGWAVGSQGTILGTHDGGESWFQVSGVTSSNLRGVWRTSLVRANAVGFGGTTPRTVLGPDSVRWQAEEIGTPHVLESVMFPTETIGWAVGFGGGGGLVLRSDNGGSTWIGQPTSAAGSLNEVFFVNPTSGWAVGDNGTILRTVTGGQP